MITPIRPIIRRCALLLAIFCAGVVLAEPGIVTLEAGIEESTDGAVFPAADTGKILFPACSGCRESLFEVTPQTQFFVGKDAVTFAELKNFARTGGPYFMMLYYKPGEKVFIRIVVSGQLPASKARSR